MEDHRFDELARTLAKPISRRHVLKALAATTIGGLMLRERTGTALADNSACVHFCNTTFGEDTPAQSQCAGDGAHGTGLCYSACGPNHPAGTSGALCGSQSGGYFTSYTGTTCCVAGSATPGCCGNTCVSLTTTTNCGSCGITCNPPHSTGASCASGTCQASNCAPGYGLSSGTCGACGPGSSSPGGTAVCAPCSSGSYSTGSANSSCTPCDCNQQCQTCVSTSGCVNQTDGTTCDDGNACTQTDTCQGGVCVGGNSVVCTASDQCHTAGTCDPTTGNCSNPAAPDGTICATNQICCSGICCGSGEVCSGGACVTATTTVPPTTTTTVPPTTTTVPPTTTTTLPAITAGITLW